ncbi:MAG: acyl-CoA desaturase [Acidimicrobiia bacterium]
MPDETIQWRTSVPFILFHFVPFAAVATGVTAEAVVLGVVLFVVRMFFITAGYHCYFAHRSYRVGRAVQFVFAFGGTTAAQKGPLWWAANHRDHHRYADTDRDPHSPQKGLLWSHVGWVLSGKYKDVDYDRIREFAQFPELRFIERHDWIGPWSIGALAFLVAGWSGVVIGFFASTVCLWHATFSVNSLAHLIGRRRYATTDTSRNSLFVSIITLGEGWHNNNHHHQPACARQGFKWWELDVTYDVLRVLSLVGVVHDLRQPSTASLEARRVRAGHPDLGLVRLHLSRALSALDGHRGAVAEDVTTLRRHLLEAADDVGRSRAPPSRPTTLTDAHS